MIIPSTPTGAVFIRNFDQGIVETLGAVVRTDTIVTSGQRRRGYWLDEVFATPMAVPVIFNNPEPIFEKLIYPCYLITRNSLEPAMQRWHSVKQLEYIAGVSGFEAVSGSPGVSGFEAVSGFSTVEVKEQAWPYDIYYTISCYSRYEYEAIPMVKRILRTYRPYSRIALTDSLSETRHYSVFAETGIQDIGEFVDIADRLKAYSMDIRVEGELDVNDPVIRDTLSGVDNRFGTL